MNSALRCLQKILPSVELSDFNLHHFLLNHRVQWFMLHHMIKETHPRRLQEMWKFFHIMYVHHSYVEDEIMIPLLKNVDEAEKVFNEHREMELTFERIGEEVKGMKDVEEIKDLLMRFARIYIHHTMEEEERIMPAIQELPCETRQSLAKAMGLYFRGVQDGAWMLLSMRDVSAYTEDYIVWSYSMSWFVRRIVAGVFLSFNRTYNQYIALFPPPQDMTWIRELEAAIEETPK